jgi:hypothetical protein
MPSGNGTPYRVTPLPSAAKQIRELGERAKVQGTLHSFVHLLNGAMNYLRMRPLEWGEPTYHPKKPGSVVCQSAIGGLFFEYVVYDPERVVIILSVIPMAGSPWCS